MFTASCHFSDTNCVQMGGYSLIYSKLSARDQESIVYCSEMVFLDLLSFILGMPILVLERPRTELYSYMGKLPGARPCKTHPSLASMFSAILERQ